MKPTDLKSNKPVILYGAEHCPYCTKAKTLMTNLKIDFEYRGTDKNA